VYQILKVWQLLKQSQMNSVNLTQSLSEVQDIQDSITAYLLPYWEL
jgi:hypothetical protein